MGHGCALLAPLLHWPSVWPGSPAEAWSLTFQIYCRSAAPLFGVDRLSAFFVVVIALGAIPAALYAIGYTREYAGKHSLAAMAFAFNVFVAAMILVPLARNVLTFLALWELMSLASYFLVITEHEREETLRAGWVYFVMTHAGFAALFVGFLLLARATGTMDFAGWGARRPNSTPTSRNLIFVLLALGFGSKAGMIPLHVWLPRAHPAAPSHVSALMSGVMIKLGVYGLVRVAFDWLGVGPLWWGATILVVGAVSGVLGVLYALVDADLKRLLAYSSVENIGIIMLGLGAAMLFQAYNCPASQRWPSSRASTTLSITPPSRACCLWARVRFCTRLIRAIWKSWAASLSACRRLPSSSWWVRWRLPQCRRSTDLSVNG